jgi:outer membrane protein assembly factor BamB
MYKVVYLQSNYKDIAMKRLSIGFVILLLLNVPMKAMVDGNWRGPQRLGVYHEKGLMQEWPAGGPEMAWSYEDLGEGFASPVIANGKIYITGMEGETGYLYMLSRGGQLEKKFPYGREFHQAYPGSRSTPAIAGNLAYIVSGHGKLVCMDTGNGEVIWERDMFGEFDGSNLRWGLTENLLIDGDRIFCTPGGKKYNIVALDRHNGEVIWASEGSGRLSSYCSPLLINHNGRKKLVTMMQSDIVGIDAATGRKLWSHPHANQRNIHPNTPIYHEGSIFAVSGYGMGGVKLRLNTAGDAVTEEWFNSDLDNQIGGVVLIDGYIFGSGDRNRRWFSVDWKTGETVYSSRDIDKGTVIWADGRLYCYTERGELALVEPTTVNFIIRGQTDITLGSAQHWAHLVIDNKILYVRRGNALMAFNIGG